MKRLFIDPATEKTGWALFINGQLVESGSIQVAGRMAERLLKIKNAYRELATRLVPDSVHVEQMNHRVHVCIWSVGAIIVGMEEAGVHVDVKAPGFQISPTGWQTWVGWRRGNALGEYRERVGSADELAAIGMGLYWHAKFGGSK